MRTTARYIFYACHLIAMVALPGVAFAQSRPADPEIVKLVPVAIQKTGMLVVGTDATYAPFESIDPKTQRIVGFDADLAEGIAFLMGLKLTFVNTSFDSIIPSIQSGKFNLAMSSIGDTKEREEVVDFVTYYWNSTSLLIPKNNTKNLGMKNVCGARIGVVRGTLQQKNTLPVLMADCPEKTPELEAGSIFKASPDAVLALASGRIDGVLNDAVAVEHAAEQSNGQFVSAGPLLRNNSPGGVAIRKESGLQQAVLAAVKKLMKDGTYKGALEKWGLTPIGIDNPVLNWNSIHN
jgi:polar amino acid transport system substrate-binding protein